MPLDNGFFCMYKNFVRFIIDTAMINDFNIWHQDNFTCLQAFKNP